MTTPRTPSSLRRDACERRVYRLATLLTGDPVAAARVIERVVDAQPDLRRLDDAHMDRLAVLAGRNIESAVLPLAAEAERLGADSADAARLAAGITILPQQQREAWVLCRVYLLPEREAACAADCSRTALRRHLGSADSAMEASLGPLAVSACDLVRRYALGLEVPSFHRARQRRRRRSRLLLRIALAAAALGATGVAIALFRD